MSAPTCYVIDAVQWDQFMGALGWAFLACFAMVWAMSVEWHWHIDRWRIHRRRRRIRAIRWVREEKRNGCRP